MLENLLKKLITIINTSKLVARMFILAISFTIFLLCTLQ